MALMLNWPRKTDQHSYAEKLLYHRDSECDSPKRKCIDQHSRPDVRNNLQPDTISDGQTHP